ncbi:MAG TPA: hypothetical protein VH595_17695 [Verrucomicrobiae bacterium]|jgi:hypothetical protein|nr:hypothetical protein [Verrucomicrobiae bacterium]
MKGVVRFLIFVVFALQSTAQPSLQFFTNQANTLLQSQFGFGVTNIPIYCPTNPAITYSASLHYALQSAANAYDATNPASNLPSVFRPLFSWESNMLYIIGYAAVTNDFYSQTSAGFKDLCDPTITTNDNVWGIPWVIEIKDHVPTFSGYGYSTKLLASRKLFFTRYLSPSGQPITNRPPEYTNQIFILAFSNLFGMQAWNAHSIAFTNSVTLLVSNKISLLLTNNENWGTNWILCSGASYVSNSWPGWGGSRRPSPSFALPFLTNTAFLPPSYWSESTRQFIPFSNSFDSNTILSSDLKQTAWPAYNWTLGITNDLMYALIDNQSGRVLDYVNLGAFGTFLAITNELIEAGSFQPPDFWAIGNATDSSYSPLSQGVLNQISTDEAADPFFASELNGTSDTPGLTFGSSLSPSNMMSQTSLWQSTNPLIHYNLQDLAVPGYPQTTAQLPLIDFITPLTNWIENGVPFVYSNGLVTVENLSPQNGAFQIQFPGVVDMPYAIWSSTDMLNWIQIGIADQPTPGSFQFTDTTASNSPARFYEVRLP